MASVWLLPTFVILGGIILVGISIWIGIRINRAISRLDVDPNTPIIDCTTRRQFTDGYSLGIVKRELPRKNGTVLIEFYPLDSEQGENKARPALQSVVIAKEMLSRLSRGESSSRREIIKVLSRNPADLPPRMLNTAEGDWMTKEGQLAHILRTFGTAIPAGDEAIHEAMVEFARGNISRATMAKQKEELAEYRRLMKLKEHFDQQQGEKK